MDTKRLVIGMTFTMAVFLGWFALVTWIESKPEWRRTPPAQQAQVSPTPTAQASLEPGTQPTGTQPTTGPAGAPAAATTMSPAPVPTGLALMPPADPAAARPAALGSDKFRDPTYALQLRTTPTGAGVDSVVLNQFLKSVKDPAKEPYVFQQPDRASLPYGYPLATRSVTVDGKAVDLVGAHWTLESHDATRATYSATLGDAGRPVLKVLKTFRVFPRDGKEHGGLGYEVRVDHDFENHAGRPLNVSLSYNGPAMPPRELDTGPDLRVMTGYRDGASVYVDNHYLETFYKDTTSRELAVNEDNVPALWAGTSSVYFQAIVMPPLLADARTSSVKSWRATGLNAEHPERQPLVMTIDTPDMRVEANQRLTFPLSVYFGPKHRDVLNVPFYATLPRDYDQTLVVRAGPCAVCTFDWLINLLVLMLGAFHTVARDWGLAIICLVVLVRLALHPITKRSQISMLKMGKMGPEMKRLQEKYKDDKQELQKAMWEFQKQQGITPILGCLPMFLQMPIWIALWSALNTTFELRHSSFLWGFTWIDDLAKPDRLIPFPAGVSFRIPLIGIIVDAFNVLPVVLAFVFYLQQKFTPKPPTMTPEQAQQQKIMQWMMVFLFPLFLYGQPSGLNLYILTSTGIGIWESKRIRQHIKEKEEAEKAGVVLVDADPPAPAGNLPGGGGGKKGKRKGGGGGPPAGSVAPPAPTPGGWLARKLAEFQKKAEELQRETERRRGRDRA